MGKGKHDNDRQGIKIPDDVKAFTKLSFKKFKKENDYIVEEAESKKKGKKRLQTAYYEELLEYFPQTIRFAVFSGHLKEIGELIDNIYGKIFDVDFIKYLTKLVKNGDKIDNIRMFPTLINTFVAKAKKDAGDESVDLSDVQELARLILKKKIKKMVGKDISEAQAFEYLSLIPDISVLAKASYFYCNRLLQSMYAFAATEEVKFGTVMKTLFKDDDGDSIDLSGLYVFTLLERKDKISNFNDGQKALFNMITAWALENIEEMSKADIERVLRSYIKQRCKDAQSNRDSNRRIYLSSIQDSEYPKISKVVSRLSEDPANKKYL